MPVRSPHVLQVRYIQYGECRATAICRVVQQVRERVSAKSGRTEAYCVRIRRAVLPPTLRNMIEEVVAMEFVIEWRENRGAVRKMRERCRRGIPTRRLARVLPRRVQPFDRAARPSPVQVRAAPQPPVRSAVAPQRSNAMERSRPG